MGPQRRQIFQQLHTPRKTCQKNRQKAKSSLSQSRGSANFRGLFNNNRAIEKMADLSQQ